MIYIHHRVNSVAALMQVPFNAGIELDVRYHENDLILEHDPFHHHENRPEKFETLLKKWRHHGPMILNLKTEGVEEKCIDLMLKYSIQSWFFLDLSMPYLIRYVRDMEKGLIRSVTPEHFSVRLSHYESIHTVLCFAEKVRWVWVDCFEPDVLDLNIVQTLKKAGFKICLVSPELHNHPETFLRHMQSRLKGILFDAVCTKNPLYWAS
jgi:hypothetical protein